MPAALSHPRLVVVGYGNMGKAIVEAGLSGGVLETSRVEVVDPNAFCRKAAAEKGLRVFEHVSEIEPLRRFQYVLLAVKPQSFAQVAAELKPRMGHGVAVVSVMAGVTIARIDEQLGSTTEVLRAMPNMAAGVRKSVTAVTGMEPFGFGGALLAAIGRPVIHVREEEMDAFTAVASSGLAYVFYLAEAVREGAVEAGLNEELVDDIVRRMIEGAAAVMRTDAASAAELRGRVTSKGGTTEAAIKVLEERGVKQAVIEAISAARDRGRELGKS